MPTAKNAHTSDVSAVRDGMKYTLQVAANLYRIDVDSDLVVEEQELIETRPNGATRIIKVPVGIHPHEIVSALFNASERPTTGVTTTEPYNRSASKSAYKIAVGAVVTVLFVGSLILIAQQLPDATQTSSTAQAIGTASTRSQGSPSQDTTTSVQDKTAVARASGNQSSSTNRSVSQPASDPSLAKLKALHPNAPTYLNTKSRRIAGIATPVEWSKGFATACRTRAMRPCSLGSATFCASLAPCFYGY
jgi:hypothetical protein